MTYAIIALVLGLILLVWSADRFVDGAASTASHLGMKPLLVGMLVVGFGTSAPEMLVSTLAAIGGSPGIALGNAYGSNIANIGLILGVTALISPIMVKSSIIKQELPLVIGITGLTLVLIWDLELSLVDAMILLASFIAFIIWSIIQGKKIPTPVHPIDPIEIEFQYEIEKRDKRMPKKKAIFWLIAGLAVLIASSRLLVWGAVEIALFWGISELMIGLTIIAIGTSLPELASCIIAARKGEHDIALGNVLGSNIFNTLAVVGIAGSIDSFSIPQATLERDMPVMGGLTVTLFLLCYSFRGRQGRIRRYEGAILLLIYLGYMGYLIYEMLP